MGLLIECPKCKQRNSPRTEQCKCGVLIKKLGHKAYWVEYYDDTGRRKRERIGPSKAAAEQRYREVLKARTEERHIHKDLGAKVALGELCNWYLSLTEVKAKASYDRDIDSIHNLERLLGEGTKIRELNVGKVESYQSERTGERSPVHPSSSIRPATVNREISCLKTMLNRAVRHGKLNENPVSDAKKLQENNVREHILTADDFQKLLDACAQHLRPVVLTAYYTGMRRSEVLGLTWGEVDFEKGFIRLRGQRTKTGVGRSIPMHPLVQGELSRQPRGSLTARVFLRRGQPLGDIKKSFRSACKRAGIEDFTFHDLRHCAINALRLAGNDYFKIMAVSGHRTMSVFKRYNVVTEEELRKLMWPDHLNSASDE